MLVRRPLPLSRSSTPLLHALDLALTLSTPTIQNVPGTVPLQLNRGPRSWGASKATIERACPNILCVISSNEDGLDRWLWKWRREPLSSAVGAQP